MQLALILPNLDTQEAGKKLEVEDQEKMASWPEEGAVPEAVDLKDVLGAEDAEDRRGNC